MTIELLPVGIKCNLSCTYCYQEPMREAGNFAAPLNLIKVKEIVSKGADFAMFGGEPLLTSRDILEQVWKIGYDKHKKNGIQTNGLLIDDGFIELFKKYNVQVGISIDGPPILNRARCGGGETNAIITNITKVQEAHIPLSLIVTIHRLNTGENLPELISFLRWLDIIGIKWINLHNLEVDNVETREKLQLTDEENLEAFKTLYDYAKTARTQFNPFFDIEQLLTKSSPSVSCIWSACDPITTPAVHGINPEGELVNCGRTNKIGIDFLKSSSVVSLERYKALWNVSQEYGGCRDCQYFFACKGQCPGTAIDGDWRNRTKDCKFWYGLIDYIRAGRDLNVEDSNRKFLNYISNYKQDQYHGDTPHGDSHGDHTDRPSYAV